MNSDVDNAPVEHPDEIEVIEATKPKVTRKPKEENAEFPKGGVVFTNTRKPNHKILLASGHWAVFHSTKLVARTPEDAALIEAKAARTPGIFREPDNFLTIPQNSDEFFVHSATGFKTLNRKAYEDWVNRSEWSATINRR